MAGMRVVVVECDDHGNVDLDDLEGQGGRARRPARGADGHVPVDARRVRGADPRDLRGRARARRPGVPRRREPQRARRRRASRASSAPTCRTSTCTRRSASRTAAAVPASGRSACRRTSRRSCRTTRCAPRPGPPTGVGRDQRRAVGLGRHPADLVGVHHDDGRRRPAPRDAGRDPQRELPRAAARAALSRCSTRARTGSSRTSASSTCARSPSDTGVTVDDVAKRLIDYGFHAPTMSFPVAGTLMIEPTESEDLGRARPLRRRDDRDPRRDRPRSARASGPPTTTRSRTRRTPPTTSTTDDWKRAYSRELAAFPVAALAPRASTGRRSAASTASTATATSFCTCPPLEAYPES